MGGHLYGGYLGEGGGGVPNNESGMQEESESEWGQRPAGVAQTREGLIGSTLSSIGCSRVKPGTLVGRGNEGPFWSGGQW